MAAFLLFCVTTDRRCPLGVVLLSSRWPTPPLSLLARRTSSEEEEGEGGMLLQKKVAIIKVSSRPGARARSLHSFWTPMMMTTTLFLTEEEDDDAHPSSETSRLWGGAGEEEDTTTTTTNRAPRAEGIARSRAGFSATGSPRTPHPKRL